MIKDNIFSSFFDEADHIGEVKKRPTITIRRPALYSNPRKPDPALKPCDDPECKYPVCTCVSGGVRLPPVGGVLRVQYITLEEFAAMYPPPDVEPSK